jgi:hypothetical protein
VSTLDRVKAVAYPIGALFQLWIGIDEVRCGHAFFATVDFVVAALVVILAAAYAVKMAKGKE